MTTPCTLLEGCKTRHDVLRGPNGQVRPVKRLLYQDGPFAVCMALAAAHPQAKGMETGAVAAGHVRLWLSAG
jgi:hypothetical protein